MKNKIFSGLLCAVIMLLSWPVATSFIHGDSPEPKTAPPAALVVPDPNVKHVEAPADVKANKTADPVPNFVVPDQKIVLDANVDAGETIFAKLSEATNTSQYLTTSTYHWKVFQDGTEKVNNVQEWPDGTSVAFGSGVVTGRKFTVIVACEYLYLVKDANGAVTAVGQRSKMLTAQTVVGTSPVPPTPPGPGPVPNPGPVVNPFTTSLQAAFTNDVDPNKAADATFVAQCLKVTASLIQDGKPHNVGSIQAGISDTISTKLKAGQLAGSLGVMNAELTSFLGADKSKNVEVPATVAELQKIVTAWQSVK